MREHTIVFRHILPNVVSLLIVSMTLDFATCMRELNPPLSYLGFGIPLPTRRGATCSTARTTPSSSSNCWWRWVFPAVVLGICTICINLIGDGLRDALDEGARTIRRREEEFMALLEMHDLKTFFTTKRGVVKAVNGVSYKVEAGRTLGVVGESTAQAKASPAMSMLQLLDGNSYIAGGSIMFDGKSGRDTRFRKCRKSTNNAISVIFQEPMTSLSPVFTIRRQVSEPFIIHQGWAKARKGCQCWPTSKFQTGLWQTYRTSSPAACVSALMIAIALACEAEAADRRREPTTALDVIQFRRRF